MSKQGEQEEYDMCLALREMRDDARAEGRVEGLMEGVAVASRIVRALQGNPELHNSALTEICQCSIKEVEVVRKAFEI